MIPRLDPPIAATVPPSRAVAGVLSAGFIVFWVGAALWSFDFQQADPAATLRAISTQQFRWIWIHLFMGAGVVLTAAGYRLWSDHRRHTGDLAASSVGASLYLAGAVLWLGVVVVRLAVTLPAATAASPPAGYPAFEQLTQGLLAGYLLLSHAGMVAFGIGLLRWRPGSRVLGIVAIVFGTFLGVGLGIGPGFMGAFMAPFLAQLCTLLVVGFLLAVRSRHGTLSLNSPPI